MTDDLSKPMSKVTIITPTDDIVVSTCVSIDDARYIVIGFITINGITDDVDAVYTNQDGIDYIFDFDKKTFSGY